MSSLLIVGADRLGSIPKRLEELGFSEIIHVNGRKAKMVKKEISIQVDFILILTDFVNHNLTTILKKRKRRYSKFRFAMRNAPGVRYIRQSISINLLKQKASSLTNICKLFADQGCEVASGGAAQCFDRWEQ